MGQEVAEFTPARLPYHPAIEERFGVDKAGWHALVGAVWPSAKSHDAVVMALSYCRARNLDPFKKPVHIVPMWSSAAGQMVETVWPGISEIRTTAFRTGQYAGCDEAEFGPDREETFKGSVKVKGSQWEDREVTVTFPEWCRITVYRDLGGRVCKFVGPKVKWKESYVTTGKGDIPNDMWATRPEAQLEKCAEAAALRKAFPEEIGNQYAAEEMEGRKLIEDVPSDRVTFTKSASIDPPSPPKVDATPLEAAVAERSGSVSETVALSVPSASAGDEVKRPPADSAEAPAEPPSASFDDYPPLPEALRREKADNIANLSDKKEERVAEIEAWLAECERGSAECKTTDSLQIEQSRLMAHYPGMLPEWALTRSGEIFTKRFNEILSASEEVEEKPFDVEQWLKDLEGACGGCEEAGQIEKVQHKVLRPAKLFVSKDDYKRGQQIFNNHLQRIFRADPLSA